MRSTCETARAELTEELYGFLDKSFAAHDREGTATTEIRAIVVGEPTTRAPVCPPSRGWLSRLLRWRP